MVKFLIDINLPYYFSLWNTEEFVHQRDLDSKLSDDKIWNYCKNNNITIITKDVDFSYKILYKFPPPRVIHIKFGNLKMKPFYEVMTNHWKQILILNQNHKLVNVFIDRIEAIE